MNIPQPPDKAWFWDTDPGQWELRDENHPTSMVAHRYAVVTAEDLAREDVDSFLASVAKVTGVPFPAGEDREAITAAAVEAAEAEAAAQAALESGQSAAIEAG